MANNLPSTRDIVEKLADDYRRAAKQMGHHRSNPNAPSWLDPDTFTKDADALEQAWKDGKTHDVPAPQLPELMEKYGATDIYHLTATYFNDTGQILQVTPE